MNANQVVGAGVVAVFGLEASMFLLDERFPNLFPFVFGMDIRYLVALCLPVIAGVYTGLKRMFRR